MHRGAIGLLAPAVSRRYVLRLALSRDSCEAWPSYLSGACFYAFVQLSSVMNQFMRVLPLYSPLPTTSFSKRGSSKLLACRLSYNAFVELGCNNGAEKGVSKGIVNKYSSICSARPV